MGVYFAAFGFLVIIIGVCIYAFLPEKKKSQSDTMPGEKKPSSDTMPGEKKPSSDTMPGEKKPSSDTTADAGTGTVKYTCRNGEYGKSYPIYQGLEGSNFNKQQYSPWGETEAKKFCLSWEANKSLTNTDGVFSKLGETFLEGEGMPTAAGTMQCRNGGGAWYVLDKNDANSNFSKEMYRPWDEAAGSKFCMSWASNKGKSASTQFKTT